MKMRGNGALLSLAAAALFGMGSVGCSSTGETVDDTPPPETHVYVEEGEGMGPEAGGMTEGGMTEGESSDVITVAVTLEGEGEARTASVSVSGVDGTFPAASDPTLVEALKSRKGEIAKMGGTPSVKITAPTDADFDAMVAPILQASFNAGFHPDAVKYDPQ